MVGLVIASHGNLAEELLATARLIVGELPDAVSCSVAPGASVDEIKRHIREAVRTVDHGEGVIVFADLMGGSPCTQSLSLCQQAKLEVLTGVNLPMLLKASSLRLRGGIALRELAHQLASYGQRNITCASDVVRDVRPTGT